MHIVHWYQTMSSKNIQCLKQRYNNIVMRILVNQYHHCRLAWPKQLKLLQGSLYGTVNKKF